MKIKTFVQTIEQVSPTFKLKLNDIAELKKHKMQESINNSKSTLPSTQMGKRLLILK